MSLSRRIRAVYWLGVALCLTGFPAGCRKADNLPLTAPVNGTVTYKGSPLPDGTVNFFPDSGDRPGIGTIGAGGKFTLTTFRRGDGAVLGKHKVIVESYKGLGDVGGPPGSKTMESAVPLKYTIRAKTPLEFDVEYGKNQFEIKLED